MKVFDRHNNEESNSKFKELFDGYYEPLVGFALSYMNDVKEAEDIVQDLFTKLWDIRDQIDYSMNVKSLVFTSTKNRCISRLRSLKYNNKSTEEDSLKYSLRELALENSTIEVVELNELREKIDMILNDLPPEFRIIFEKNRIDHQSYITIAEELNISVKTVEKKMSLTLKAMRKNLSDYDYLLFLLSL